MTSEKIKLSLAKLRQAINRLKEALDEKKDNLVIIDGTIQRFEFVFEQCWKTLQQALSIEGIEARTPREVIQKAYQAGWLQDESLWLKMLKDRNETSHTYDEDIARRIFSNIPGYFSAFGVCLKFIEQRLDALKP